MRPATLQVRPRLTPKLTTGSPALDRHLAGGFPCGSVTEIAGESGSGKTQLCLQIALLTQLPPSLGGLSASSLFLYSEFPFPSRRLNQLAQSLLSTRRSQFARPYNPLDHVFVHPLQTADHLLDELPRIESFIESSRARLPVRLIVIDSIAALFRSEFDNTPVDLKRRSSIFFKISGRLKSLAKKFDLAVILTNQVVDLVGPSEGANGLKVGNLRYLYSSGRRVSPALGLAWANCVNSRIFLSREEEEVLVDEPTGPVDEGSIGQVRVTRRLHVIFSPHLPYSSCEFLITREGIQGIERWCIIPHLYSWIWSSRMERNAQLPTWSIPACPPWKIDRVLSLWSCLRFKFFERSSLLGFSDARAHLCQTRSLGESFPVANDLCSSGWRGCQVLVLN